MSLTWLNGEPRTEIGILDRGLAYGDGLFETIRVEAGEPRLLELHIQRLSSDARRLGIKLEPQRLRSEIRQCLKASELTRCILKVVVTRGVGGRGYSPADCISPSRIIACFDPPEYPGQPSVNGVRLFECQTPLGLSPALAGMKHLNRLEQVLARAEWSSPEYAEGLMLDLNGFPVEGTMSNLFLASGGRLLTPDLRLCGVAGVCRQYIINQAQAWQLPLEIASFSCADMVAADEVFVCNSVFGVWPVVAWGNHQWSIGPLTRAVQKRVGEALSE
ncbi:aminodeoxychorismate lyase [Aestuariirhabdus litorea]|uniref:Aminodeoxychorismate lyase n=1 Tax=Aestuariirhabdus litorea TaxID=2528527 RepID=A0A3P3VSN9_9GAMM|nr:aminodeoxychorismate lyase [Aestuariirhabdus litorea]RRJ84706.1 aminodeoxychorismate lyase [Aestuariirhabdus litorea]RWW97931.1 aminodeoxychorismate lyase [Endozoicomonadaceae bacterium GTF-13]